MGRKTVHIQIHGTLLKGMIRAESKLEEFGKKIGVTRMTVHQWVNTGRISPRHLSEVVAYLPSRRFWFGI